MGRLRLRDTEAAYDKVKESGVMAHECPLCKASSIHSFDAWRIIGNDYPYDGVARVHHMLITKRHVGEEELTEEEWQEYQRIKREYVNDNYEFIMEALPRRKSIPTHMHTHLIIESEV